MTITVNKPDNPRAEPHAVYEVIEIAPPAVAFNTSHYEAAHGKAPHANTVGTWSFLPPRHLGKRPLQFVDMSFSAAKKGCLDAVGERPAYGEFVLIP